MKTYKCRYAQKDGHPDLSGYVLLCSASYEKRWRCIPVAHLETSKVYLFTAVDCDPTILKEAAKFRRERQGVDQPVELKIGNPIHSADYILAIIQEIIKCGWRKICIDITTFTHEHLLMLLRIVLASMDKFDKVICAYMHASEYSIGDAVKTKWLSKGCREVRSVIGYPGMQSPLCSTDLIVLSGYEYERAMCMIDEICPESLTIGRALLDECTHKHEIPEEGFLAIVARGSANCWKISDFRFHSSDVNVAMAEIQRQIKLLPNFNHIIAPMNSKLSTLAVACIAAKEQSLQVCYAEPERYNIFDYASPGDYVTYVEIK